MKRTICLALFWTLIALPVAAAPNDESTPDIDTASEPTHVAQARRHFQRGVDLYREGDHNAAFAELSKAYELSPNYRLLYNLAQVQAERRDYVAAIDFFERYLVDGSDEIPREREEEVRKEIALLSERVGKISIQVNVSDAELVVNGVSKGKVSKTRPVGVNAGSVTIEVRKPGYAPHSAQLQLTGGEVVDLRVELKPQASSAPAAPAAIATPPTREQEPQDEYSHTRSWISLAATAALGGATATFALLTTRADERLDEELDQFPADSDAIEKQRKELRTYAALTDGFGAGTVVAAALTVYFFANPARVEEEKPNTASLGFSVTPSGAAMHGSF